MSKIHVLESQGSNLYRAVVHAPIPAGNNSAGFTWKVALVNSGMAVTEMTVGNGAGQIAQNEANQIASGDVFEAPFIWQNDPNWTAQQRIDDLALRANQAVAEKTLEIQARLAVFGFTSN